MVRRLIRCFTKEEIWMTYEKTLNIIRKVKIKTTRYGCILTRISKIIKPDLTN